jgi:hypothetical protein
VADKRDREASPWDASGPLVIDRRSRATFPLVAEVTP